MWTGHVEHVMNLDVARIADCFICSIDELFQQRVLHNFANHVKSLTMTLCVL